MNSVNTLTGAASTYTITAQPQQITIGNYPSGNPNFARQVQLTSDAVIIRKPGTENVAIKVSDIVALAVSLYPNLTYKPLITTQPTSQSCVHSSTAATFTIVASAETAITYQWQYSVDGVSWSNATGTVNGCVYTNGTTASLTCTPTTTGQTGYFHRCVATNATGSTNSSSAVLTIT